MTIDEAKNLKYGMTVYSIHHTNADGTPMRFKVQGKPKTWKRQPDAVRVTVKRGLKDYYTLGFLVSSNLHLDDFTTSESEACACVYGRKYFDAIKITNLRLALKLKDFAEFYSKRFNTTDKYYIAEWAERVTTKSVNEIENLSDVETLKLLRTFDLI